MIDVLQSIAAFIIALGVLITFHEFGHYWVARRCNVKILRFSIGFGRPIYKRIFGSDKTEFVIAALPLGGYVKMLDAREEEVSADELPREFNNKSINQRFAIVAAGPAFNFIFAVFAYWLIFMIGVNGLKPIIGKVEPGSISAQAGLREGQEIITVDDIKTPTWTAVIGRLVNHTVSGERARLGVVDNSGSVQSLSIDMSRISIDEMAQGHLLQALGISIVKLKPPPVIGEIIYGGPANEAGLLANDEIIAVNGARIESWNEWVATIRKHPDQLLSIDIIRDNNAVTLTLVPEAVEVNGKTIGRIGAAVYQPDDLFEKYFTLEAYAPWTAFLKAVDKTWEMSLLTLKFLGKMLTGDASVKNISGPISIAKYAGQTAGIGIIAFLGFMAIISVSLGVFNILPVPVLDGGHLAYYVIELIIGRPIPDSAQLWGQQIGLVLLLGLMSLAIYNDISRLF